MAKVKTCKQCKFRHDYKICPKWRLSHKGDMAGGSGTDEWVWLKKAGICIKFKKVIVRYKLKTTAWCVSYYSNLVGKELIILDTIQAKKSTCIRLYTTCIRLYKGLILGNRHYRIVKVRIEEVK